VSIPTGAGGAAAQAPFSGIPARAKSTAVADVLFADVLPSLADDAAALGVTLYALKTLQAKRGSPRYITAGELEGDPSLAAFLANARADRDAIAGGLARAAGLGVLLPLAVERDGQRAEVYFLNAPADRRAREAVRGGAMRIEDARPAATAPHPAVVRSSVFALYESVIGPVSPLVVDDLSEAARLYPHEWLEAAFREAAAQNARSWRYVSRILERWAVEGPDHAKTPRDPAGGGAAADDRYFRGKFGRILKRRLGS
jgi:DnaD/phage-associated family protein